MCSVIPEGLEVDRFAKIKSSWDEEMDHCFAISVIIVQNGKVVFKHELYRRTIEESLTPFRRLELNKMVLELFLDSFEEKGEIERILHYAKNANEKELVARYAPEAASKAALIGAHKEASKLFLTAIEYCEGNDTQLAEFYEAYAYECYLSNQVKEAIAFTEKILILRKKDTDIGKTWDALRFLSHLWWFEGNRRNAENYARAANELFKDHPVLSTKARAFDEPAESISDEKECISLLQQKLEIALKDSYHEHAARAYTNLGSGLVRIKKFAPAGTTLGEGIRYCEEKGFDSWTAYMLSWKARLDLYKGNCTEACKIADNLLKNENQPAIIKINALIVLAKLIMRKGEKDALPLLQEAETLSFETKELQRIIPSMVALLEYEWLTGKTIIENADIEQMAVLMQQGCIDAEKNEFAFWMKKAGRHLVPLKKVDEAYDISGAAKALTAAFWENAGCPYEQALAMFEGKDDDKRKAIAMVQDLGATAVYEKMKQEMRNLGITKIPRGIRDSTRSNPALLTGRELDVLKLLKEELHTKEIAAQLYISAKTAEHHISSILFKLDANSRSKAVTAAVRMGILK